MNKNNLEYYLALSIIDGIGSITAKKIISYFRNIENVFSKNSDFSKIPGISDIINQRIRTAIKSESLWKKVDEIINYCNKNSIKILTYVDKEYPVRLLNCDDSPIILYSKGNIDFNSGFFISIVGTRKATQYGKDFCKTLVENIKLHNLPVSIVSGFAYGIDITAHKSAIENNLPTIVVLPAGFDKIYPSTHIKYLTLIYQNGSVISEFAKGVKIEKGMFVRRNRIIAAISDATIVVESCKDGGAMTTADFAFQYNREVFALPGRIDAPYSEGPNLLIKSNKANLIENIDDLCKVMGWKLKKDKEVQQTLPLLTDFTVEEKCVIEVLKNKNNTIDLIALTTNLPVHKVSSILVNLEFKGIVRALPGKMYELCIKI
ncbi:MAG: DNA-processing protein DprA [Bacteroidales bacterium]|nr:DNA-processing protein DprA [Bacteroidales bacterium]